MADGRNRDELGRFAAPKNGGGANFAPPVELPTTSEALLKNATPHQVSAPVTARITHPQFADDPAGIGVAVQAGEAFAARGGGGFDRAAEGGGHGEAGHPGEWHENLSEHFLPHDPDDPSGQDSGAESTEPGDEGEAANGV